MRKATLLKRIQEEDPGFDPIGTACEAAGVPVKLFREAESYVAMDGWHGPFTVAEWASDREPGDEPGFATMTEAQEILSKVYDEVPAYSEAVPCDEDCYVSGESEDEQCNGDHGFEETVSSTDLRHDLFAWYHEIYGSYPS